MHIFRDMTPSIPTLRRLFRLAATLACVLRPLAAQVMPRTPASSPVPNAPTAAQSAAESYAGRRVSNLELSEAIRTSGLSASQIRARLAAAGFDPTLADPFFSADSAAPAFLSGAGNTAFASALTEIGLLSDVTAGEPSTGLGSVPGAVAGYTGSPVFGKDLFSGRTGVFEPIVSGPVDASYRLGVGDQLQVVLTGEVEAAFQQLDVRRDGTILMPQVGQVAVSGLTLEAARTLLAQRAAQLYSGIPSGRTKLDLSLSRIRSIQVYVIGDVESPGAIQLNALSTVFVALARAGGPTSRGTFRRVEVRRANRVLQTVDLYHYLLGGDASQDVRLEQGDIVFVRLANRAVAVSGGVRRPGQFEMADNEGFRDLLRFAGGFSAEASFDRVQIDRVLEPSLRTPGRDRVVLDLLLDSAQTALDTVHLRDGDRITVPTVASERRDRVTVSGEVYLPGSYQWAPGMTLDDLLGRAEGTLPWALTDRVKLFRAIRNTGSQELLNLDLTAPSVRETPLVEFDSVVVLDGRLLYPVGSVRVSGAVNQPGVHSFATGQTLRDLIDLSGGLKPEAGAIEVAREVRRAEYSDTSSILFQFELASADRASWEAFRIDRGDVISVRSNPGFRLAESVTLVGEFRAPGVYVIANDRERLSEIVERAGGLLPTAAPEAFQLVRDGRVVAVDYERIAAGSRRDDLTLRPGDQLRVVRRSNTVRVSGGVRREVIVPFDPRWSVNDYISAAGGYSDRAKKGVIVVEYASGEISQRKRWLGLTLSNPRIRPGSAIAVAIADTDGGTWRDTLATVAQVSSILVSLVVAWSVAGR